MKRANSVEKVEIVRFQGKGQSFLYNLNFLYRYGNIYVMDNHNTALWCWLKELKTSEKYNILHVDRHYDTRTSHINEWIEEMPEKLNELSVQDYLSLQYQDPNFKTEYNKLMTWDNYFPIFHRKYINHVASYHFFTHRQGMMFDEMNPFLIEYPINGFVSIINSVFTTECSNKYKWIVNLDLDYFYSQSDLTDDYIQIVSNDAISNFCKVIGSHLQEKIEVMTIALSPECCGGWENSLKIMRFVAKRLKIKFDL